MKIDNSNAIIVFVRYPVTGKVKTRLASETGDEFAFSFYKICSENTFAELKLLKEKEYDIYVFGSEEIELDKIKEWTGNIFYYHSQTGADLGRKMLNAFEKVFKKKYRKVIIVGTDIPGINYTLIQDAFNNLDNYDCVIGPANDGGYYLLGFKDKVIDLFSDIRWGSDSVFDKTIKKIRQHKVDFYILEELIDIDTKDDLLRWYSKSTGVDNHPVCLFINSNRSELL
jgi:hypothetical protein